MRAAAASAARPSSSPLPCRRDDPAASRERPMKTLSRILATATLAAGASLPLAASAQDGNAQSWLNAFLADFAEGDVEGMVAAHAEDAIFLTPQGALVGRDQ